jgi:hypothetical protein
MRSGFIMLPRIRMDEKKWKKRIKFGDQIQVKLPARQAVVRAAVEKLQRD